MISKDLVAASSRPLILSILSEGESYGYEIMQKIRQCSQERIEWSEGMLYPVLHRLEREGLISARWAQAENGRERKYYELTKDGRKSLQQERDQWLIVHDTLTKLWNPNPALT